MFNPLFEPFGSRWRDEDIWIHFTRRVFELAKVEGASADEHAEGIREIFGPSAFSLFEEVPAVLDDLKGRGVHLAVISNWHRGLSHFLRELALLDHFEAVICSAEFGCAKPDVRIFEEACRLLDMEPSQIAHVGDEPDADANGALAAGMKPVLVARRHYVESSVTVIRSLDDLVGVLGQEG
jgi:putative hydrolase of the HAD superfamily